jgi:hypothetical protein
MATEKDETDTFALLQMNSPLNPNPVSNARSQRVRIAFLLRVILGRPRGASLGAAIATAFELTHVGPYHPDDMDRICEAVADKYAGQLAESVLDPLMRTGLLTAGSFTLPRKGLSSRVGLDSRFDFLDLCNAP